MNHSYCDSFLLSLRVRPLKYVLFLCLKNYGLQFPQGVYPWLMSESLDSLELFLFSALIFLAEAQEG